MARSPIANYIQWLNAYRKGERKRAYWVCGPQRRLVEEVIDATIERIGADDFGSVTLFAGETRDRDIWAQLDALPTSDARRLVLIRDAENITNWEPLEAWWDEPALRSVHAVFVSNEFNTDTSVPHMRLFVGRGKFVRCGPFIDPGLSKFEKRRDQRLDVIAAHGTLSPPATRALLERTRGNMNVVLDFLAKCAVLPPQTIEEPIVRALVPPVPAEDYVDALIEFRAPDAFEAARDVAIEEYSRAIGWLDTALGQLSRLNRALRKADRFSSRGDTRLRSIMSATGLEPFIVTKLLPHARRYDQQQVRTCIQALALADSRVAEGETDLVLETLTAVWMTRS